MLPNIQRCCKFFSSIIRFLLPLQLGRSPLHWAARFANLYATRLLLKYGASSSLRDKVSSCRVFLCHEGILFMRRIAVTLLCYEVNSCDSTVLFQV